MAVESLKTYMVVNCVLEGGSGLKIESMPHSIAICASIVAASKSTLPISPPKLLPLRRDSVAFDVVDKLLSSNSSEAVLSKSTIPRRVSTARMTLTKFFWTRNRTR